jgi:hypothetical protein
MKTWLGASGRSEKFGQVQQMDLIHGQVNLKLLAGASAISENVGQDENNHGQLHQTRRKPWPSLSEGSETIVRSI